MRAFSFAVESTRYCNYSSNRFGNELTFIIPPWAKHITEGKAYWHDGICYRSGVTDNNVLGTYSWTKPSENEDINAWFAERKFIEQCDNAERYYFDLLVCGWKPQQARNILPLATKCEIVMTGFVSDWKHFFNLRYFGTTGAPHPQAKELAELLHKEFITRGYINGSL